MSFTLTLNDHFGPTLESNLLAGDHKMYNLRGKLYKLSKYAVGF